LLGLGVLFNATLKTSQKKTCGINFSGVIFFGQVWSKNHRNQFLFSLTAIIPSLWLFIN